MNYYYFRKVQFLFSILSPLRKTYILYSKHLSLLPSGTGSKNSPALKSFAMTLQFYSAKAYEFDLEEHYQMFS